MIDHLPVMLIISPLAAAFLAALAAKIRPVLQLPISITAAVLHVLAAVQLAGVTLGGQTLLYFPGSHAPPAGIVLVGDSAAAFFLLIVSCGYLLSLLYVLGTDGLSVRHNSQAVLINLYFCSLSGVVLAGDIFNLYVFIELATVSSIGLIVMKRRAAGTVAGFVYIMAASISGVFLLFAVVLIYVTTGHLSMAAVSLMAAEIPLVLHGVICACILISFGIKIGLVPLHFWQPRAYHAAGSTAAAILSAFGMKVYIYALIRVLFIPLRTAELLPQVFTILLYAGMLNILLGHIMALIDRDAKRLLAFSSVAHAGYILLAVGAAGLAAVSAIGVTAAGAAGTVAGSAAEAPAVLAVGSAAVLFLSAGLLHILGHAAMKSGLFWSLRGLIAGSGSSKIYSFAGASARAPLHITVFALCASAIVGMPPTLGFASKWHIAAAQDSLLPILVISLGTVISLYYYARILSIALQKAAENPEAELIVDVVPGGSSPIPECQESLPGKRGQRKNRALAGLEALIILLLAASLLLSGPFEHHILAFLANASESIMDFNAYQLLLFPGGIP
ncbi:complex I subunit 5 family protein [Spirochaeta dissipatitropha]